MSQDAPSEMAVVDVEKVLGPPVEQVLRVLVKTTDRIIMSENRPLTRHVESKKFVPRVRAYVERIIGGEKVSLPKMGEALGLPVELLVIGFQDAMADHGYKIWPVGMVQ